VPIVLHEANARPGFANRLGARWAAGVGLAFRETPLRAPHGLTEFVGMPLRPEIERLAHLEARRAARAEAVELGRRLLQIHKDNWPGWEGSCEIRPIFTGEGDTPPA
jgi:UDP-N-acetylglucosamine--N-acetylmuramyl-(pentapeptide) pyrophosphoryl-undecaprenol N-acetylglucosamine transferase